MVKRRSWEVTEARKRLGELVDKAQTETPQSITRRGEQVVIVVSKQEFARLKRRHPSRLGFFRESPLVGVRLDLERGRSLPRGVGKHEVWAKQAGR